MIHQRSTSRVESMLCYTLRSHVPALSLVSHMPGAVYRGLALCICRIGGGAIGRSPSSPRALANLLAVAAHSRAASGLVLQQDSHSRRLQSPIAFAEMSTSSSAGGKETGDGNVVKPTIAEDGRGVGYRERKAAMRKSIKSALKLMTEDEVDAGSAAVVERLLATPQLKDGVPGAGGGASGVSVYLSMPGELATKALVSELFRRGKKVYIPKVRNKNDMFSPEHEGRLFLFLNVKSWTSFHEPTWSDRAVAYHPRVKLTRQ